MSQSLSSLSLLQLSIALLVVTIVVVVVVAVDHAMAVVESAVEFVDLARAVVANELVEPEQNKKIFSFDSSISLKNEKTC